MEEQTKFIICEDYKTMAKEIGNYLLETATNILDLNINELEKDAAYEVYYTLYEDSKDKIVRLYYLTRYSSLLKFYEGK